MPDKKEYSQEEREAAAKAVLRRAWPFAVCSRIDERYQDLMKDKSGILKGEQVVDLQCTLTRMEKERDEARSLFESIIFANYGDSTDSYEEARELWTTRNQQYDLRNRAEKAERERDKAYSLYDRDLSTANKVLGVQSRRIEQLQKERDDALERVAKLKALFATAKVLMDSLKANHKDIEIMQEGLKDSISRLEGRT